MQKKLHLALSVGDIGQSVADYSRRLGWDPVLVIPGEYALWRTDTLNLSIRVVKDSPPGILRHLGWENDQVAEFTSEVDCNGLMWEEFSSQQQMIEIRELWPDAGFGVT